MNKTKIHIALLLMCKNETKRIHVTLESIIGFVDSIVIYDTGSTDNTIDILTKFSKKHNIPLRLKQGEFIDFSTSRNVSLNFADSFDDIDYILLLDVNDELRGGKELRILAEQFLDKPNSAFLLCQEWWSGQYDKYYNIRFIKSRKGWRYRGRIHEYFKQEIEDGADKIRIDDNVILYQDRTQDDDKSSKRFSRDKILLLEDHKDNPTDSRTLFYLAQTCSCLNDSEDALYYYKLRTELEGFWEERFQAFYRCGITSERLNHPWYDCMTWYMKAFEKSERVEPLIKIIEHYKDIKNWKLAYTFAELACKLEFPSQCILFVDKHCYDYTRWHLMGIVGWYAKEYENGKKGCLKAIECGLNNELDTSNLKFYEDHEKDNSKKPIITRTQFITKTTEELTKKNPNLSKKQIASKVNKLWKDHR